MSNDWDWEFTPPVQTMSLQISIHLLSANYSLSSMR